jgi:hypothetical protein
MGGYIAPAALPVALQTTLPAYIFGLTDFYGGFPKANTILPPGLGWFRSGFNQVADCGIVGYTFVPTFGVAPLPPYVNGDLVMMFWDVLPGGIPNFIAWVVIHCNNVAYGTFLNSFVSDLITIDLIRYIVPIANINQLANPVFFGTQSLFGKTKFDSIDPRMYITSRDFQQQIADIPVNLPIDKTLMTGFQLDVFCQQVSWVLFVKKVEPLTHKK